MNELNADLLFAAEEALKLIKDTLIQKEKWGATQ
jgi:hypothetical protein